MPIFDYSSLIGGAISGLILLGARFYYEYWKERRETKRELSGIMRLLFSEINGNNALIKAFKMYPDATRPYLASMKSSVWDESKMRLAGLIEDDHFDALLLYYNRVEDIKRDVTTKALDHLDSQRVSQLMESDFKDAKHFGKLAIAHGSKYVFQNHAELTDHKHKELVEAVRNGEYPETW